MSLIFVLFWCVLRYSVAIFRSRNVRKFGMKFGKPRGGLLQRRLTPPTAPHNRAVATHRAVLERRMAVPCAPRRTAPTRSATAAHCCQRVPHWPLARRLSRTPFEQHEKSPAAPAACRRPPSPPAVDGLRRERRRVASRPRRARGAMVCERNTRARVVGSGIKRGRRGGGETGARTERRSGAAEAVAHLATRRVRARRADRSETRKRPRRSRPHTAAAAAAAAAAAHSRRPALRRGLGTRRSNAALAEN